MAAAVMCGDGVTEVAKLGAVRLKVPTAAGTESEQPVRLDMDLQELQTALKGCSVIEPGLRPA